MTVDLITKEDLANFKKELLIELVSMLKEKTSEAKWLKAPQVRKLLSISPGTLQNLRINGTLPYTKVGGVTYYAMSDIEKIMQSSKSHPK